MKLQTITGIGPATEQQLEAAGVSSVEQLAGAAPVIMAAKTGLAEDKLSAFIDATIRELPDWQDELLSRIRGLINQADPDGGGGQMANAIEPVWGPGLVPRRDRLHR